MILKVRRAAWVVGLPLRFALIAVIRLYRVTLSGMFGGQCRFYPSCSHYAESAIRDAGALQGTGLAAWRVLRCSPLSRGGVDHPPSPPAWRAASAVSYDSVIPAPRDPALRGQPS